MQLNIINLCLITSLFKSVESFSVMHRNDLKEHSYKFKRFDISSINTIATHQRKNNNEAKLFFQNQKDCNDSVGDKGSHLICLSRHKSLTQKGRSMTNKLRKSVVMVDSYDYNKNNVKKVDSHYHDIKEKYEHALKKARDIDLKCGLCSNKSLDTWKIVDEIYMKLKNCEETEQNYKFNSILEARDLLETILKVQEKIN